MCLFCLVFVVFFGVISCFYQVFVLCDSCVCCYRFVVCALVLSASFGLRCGFLCNLDFVFGFCLACFFEIGAVLEFYVAFEVEMCCFYFLFVI